jgi:hypothetical protein
MPQLSLYIDEPTLKKVEIAAKNQHLSISKWVADQIKSRVNAVYPKDYENLFGSISDDSFVEPNDLVFANDIKREEM